MERQIMNIFRIVLMIAEKIERKKVLIK